MVFANLQSNEKDAFFSLLDEYFQSRPEIFAASSANSQDVSGVAASAVHRAMANNPEATAKIVSAGLRHAAGQTKPPGGVAGGAGAGGANASSENDVSGFAGRVAAASMAFSNRHNPSPSSSSTSPPPIAEKPPSFSSVRQKFGEVDTSSPKNIFGSLRGSTAASKTTSPPPPQAPAPAFTARQNNSNFGPPPTRHNPPPPPPSRQQPEEEEEEEEEQQGEWANVLYDYDSGEAGDLVIKEGQRVLVTERTSDDWWTGELNGKKGLFPASYVEPL